MDPTAFNTSAALQSSLLGGNPAWATSQQPGMLGSAALMGSPALLNNTALLNNPGFLNNPAALQLLLAQQQASGTQRILILNAFSFLALLYW